MTAAERLKNFSTTPRILGVDLARGLAVLGMFGAHIGVTKDVDLSQPSTWLGVVHGNSSILFALIAGVSIAILSGGSRPLSGVELLQARTRIFARAALIFAIGGLLQLLGTNVLVILPVYALLFVLSLPFLRWRSRYLFLLAAALAVVSPLLLLFYSTVTSGIYLQTSAILELFVTGAYPGVVWIVFLLVGLGIGRLDLTSVKVAARVAVAGLILALAGFGLGSVAQAALAPVPDATSQQSNETPASNLTDIVDGSEAELDNKDCEIYSDGIVYCYPYDYFESVAVTGDDSPIDDLAVLATASPHSGSPFEIVGSTGFALLVLGLSLLVLRIARWVRWVLYPLIAVGAMALTAYSLHLVALAIIGQDAYIQVDNSLYLLFVIITLIGCTAWTIAYGRGPLERLLSWVSRRAARLTPKLDPTPEPIEKV